MGTARRGRILTIALVAAMTLGVLAAPASAADSGATQISGVGFGVTECDGKTSDVVLEMTGDLEGCLYATVTDFKWIPSSGVYMEWGTERFEGCWDVPGDEDVCGAFATTYKFTAKFPPGGDEPNFAEEIHGRCQHPIVEGSGEGEFEGVTGRFDIKDDVETGEFPYRGHLMMR